MLGYVISTMIPNSHRSLRLKLTVYNYSYHVTIQYVRSLSIALTKGLINEYGVCLRYLGDEIK